MSQNRQILISLILGLAGLLGVHLSDTDGARIVEVLAGLIWLGQLILTQLAHRSNPDGTPADEPWRK